MLYTNPDNINSIVIQNLDNMSGTRRFIDIDDRPEPCSVTIDKSTLARSEETLLADDRERRFCSICGELCFREDMREHPCIIEHNADPQRNFLIMHQFNKFYPITDNGKSVLIDFEDSGEHLNMAVSLDKYQANDKEFCSIDVPPATTMLSISSAASVSEAAPNTKKGRKRKQNESLFNAENLEMRQVSSVVSTSPTIASKGKENVGQNQQVR